MNSIIKYENVTKKYGKKIALNNFSIEIKENRIIGLLGENGAGKTTLIKLCAGLLTPNSGDIKVNNHNIGVSTKSIVSYLPDMEYLPEQMKIKEIIKTYNDFFADFNVDKAYEMLSTLKLDENDVFKKLSKGNKEKVQLIIALSRDAKVFLLDEPLGGVDAASRSFIIETILNNYNTDSTLIISTHLIADIESILDEVILIKDGNLLLQKDAEEIRIEENKSIDEYFREVYKCY